MLEDRLNDAARLTEQLFSGGLDLDALAEEYSDPDLCDFLERTVEELKRVVAGMSPEQLAYRLPGAPEGPDESGDEHHFDASQIVTHVASGLSFHRWHITRALRHDRPQFPKPPEGAPVTGKKKNAMGGGGWSGATHAELIALLDEACGAFLVYARGLPEGTDMRATARFGVFGDLSAHGWLFLACVHPAMHLKQIRDMQAQPDFPAT